jgi:hypothetical protein
MTDLSAAIDIAVDTDPLLLRDALESVLSRCDKLETDLIGNPSPVGRVIAEQFRTDVAKALKVSYP